MNLTTIPVGPFKFDVRPNTMDQMIFGMVVGQNEYRMSKEVAADKVVLDIGGHIGSFAFLALAFGAKSVDSYEVFPDNYELTKHNLMQFGDRAKVYQKAVWRSDIEGHAYRKENIEASFMGLLNTGGEGVLETDGVQVETISLDSIIDSITEREGQNIDILKIDVEGCEYPILMTSTRLDKVNRIVGEYHIIQNMPANACIEGMSSTPHELKIFLEENNFIVQLIQGPLPHIGFIFADKAL